MGLRRQERRPAAKGRLRRPEQGGYWDHVAFDSRHPLFLEVVPGARTIENIEVIVSNACRRIGDRLMSFLISDDYPAYDPAIHRAYGAAVTPPRTSKAGQPQAAVWAVPQRVSITVVE